MSWTCTQFETVLSEYREGTLPAPDAADARRHLGTCAACTQLLESIAGAQAALARLPELDPPAALLSRLVAIGPAPKAAARRAAAARHGGWRAAWAAVTSPRFAMGVAMSVFAVALLLNAAQVNLRQVFTPGGISQLSPASLTSALQRRVDRAWARGVSYYHDLRVVYEIEAAIHQMRQQTPPPAAASPATPDGHDRSQRGPASLPGDQWAAFARTANLLARSQ